MLFRLKWLETHSGALSVDTCQHKHIMKFEGLVPYQPNALSNVGMPGINGIHHPCWCKNKMSTLTFSTS